MFKQWVDYSLTYFNGLKIKKMIKFKILNMKKNSLVENSGLSLSQAQSISNLCNQRAIEIGNKLESVNNYGKKITIINGSDKKTHELTAGIPLPKDTVKLLTERAKLYGCQAFLMENIKAKVYMISAAKNGECDVSSVILPIKGDKVNVKLSNNVDESYGWSQLMLGEINEFHEAEAYASHIGQFIHRDGLLDRLRAEFPNIPSIEWMTIQDGTKTPVEIEKHHTAEELHELHEELATLHRKHEQRVNYFKAKVKNLTTAENADIAKKNAIAQTSAETENNKINEKYRTELASAQEKIKTLLIKFEEGRQAEIKMISSMRINVDGRFQDTIDIFLKKLEDKK